MHRAWAIVALAFTTQFFANTIGFYAFAVVLAPIQATFDATRANVSMIAFALSVSGAVIAPLVGRAVTRIPIHRLLAAGAFVCGCCFLAMSRATAIWQLQLGYAIGVALALATLSGVGVSTLIVNWFQERRAVALGVAGIGISLAGAVMTPITSGWVEAYGWRHTFVIFAWLMFALLPVVWFFAPTQPRDRGLLAYGATAAPAHAGPGEVATQSTGALLRTPNIWLISGSAGICFMAASGVIAHVVTLGIDAGFDPLDAAFLLSATAALAAVAKVAFGWLAGRIGDRAALLICIVLIAIGLAGLATLQESYAPLLVAAGVFGFGMGGVMPLMSSLFAHLYGAENFGPVMGLSGPILIVFQSTGAPVLGFVYDLNGNYTLGLWIFCAALVLPAAAITAVRDPEANRAASN